MTARQINKFRLLLEAKQAELLDRIEKNANVLRSANLVMPWTGCAISMSATRPFATSRLKPVS